MLELDWDDMDRQLGDIGSLRSVRVDYNEMAEFQVDEFEAYTTDAWKGNPTPSTCDGKESIFLLIRRGTVLTKLTRLASAYRIILVEMAVRNIWYGAQH
ncbi:hypothetical protein NUW54_g6110 [Trametes sanguinea]|uniref:Uncharacterized protein n=1 Tax=Trametes sanguinea TaxID=158606 RepID=A0ACC1PU73_9APHY|nr:hypothetical protein NUW54_g6110 [Trametes sanguinea]